MTKLVKEEHKCFQGEEILSLFVLCVDEKRVFASEDLEELAMSPSSLEKDGDAVGFKWGGDSLELPSFGPVMDEEYYGELQVRREADHVIFEAVCNEDLKYIGGEWKLVWDKIVDRFFRKHYGTGIRY